MDAIQAFQQAACLLQQEPCYLELKAAREANDTDTSLQEMIKQYGQIRVELDKAIAEGNAPVELDAQATRLYGEIMAYPGIVRYHTAKVKAEALISHLGNIITTAMNGGDPFSVEATPAACSGSCKSCNGCSSEKH